MTGKHWKRMLAGGAWVLAAASLTRSAPAQSADALIDKLVEKGVLTVSEAKELRAEADQGCTRAYAIKSGLPSWVTALKLKGDLRARYEGFYSDNPAFVDRNRFRYRLRFGATAELSDRFEVGLRLSSSEPTKGGFGGDPISGNTTFSGNGSRKWVWIDLAYAQWSPLDTSHWTAATTVGKMENPFTFPSTILFDKDYNPEGLAQQWTFRFDNRHALEWAGGGFALREISGSSRDPYLAGTQLHWNAAWCDRLSSSVGAGWFAVLGTDRLASDMVPDQNRGNTRTAAGELVSHFNPVYFDASVTYELDSFPLYPAPFPIRVSGDYLHNPAASRANEGYSLGVKFGKSGKKGLWEVSYRWTELQADAWYEEFTESDFGAFYQAAPIGGTAGYGSGTNVRGHEVQGTYSPYDSLDLSVTCFLTELIDQSPAGSDSDMVRLQVDGSWKF